MFGFPGIQDNIPDQHDVTKIFVELRKIMRTRASQAELEKIEKAMNAEKKARVFKRYQALYLFLSGKTCKEIASIVGITANTVCNLHKIYQKEGLAGIPDKPIFGRPSRLTGEQRIALKEMIIHKVPAEVGFAEERTWTADLIGKYIKREYGYDYSIRGITGMLKRMKLLYTRFTYVRAQTDHSRKRIYKRFSASKKLLN
jgi:putative transposase